MKKLIAISVVFALVAGAAFAVDVGASVIGSVNVLQGDTGKDAAGDSTKVTGGGGMKQVRIDGSGEANENFGGYFRVDSAGGNGAGGIDGYAWWKPIDQFRLLIGGNGGDGFYGKEGVAGWSFYQTLNDVEVTMQGGSVWGGSAYSGIYARKAFFGGDGGADNLRLELTPMDMLGINLMIPFLSKAGQEAADIFKQTVAQIDLKLEGVGNIALTYVGGRGYNEGEAGVTTKKYEKVDGMFIDSTGTDSVYKEVSTTVGGIKGYDEPASIFVYYGGSFGDLSVDFGLSYTMANHYTKDDAKVKAGDKDVGDGGKANPIGIGLGVKYATDAFGVKFRAIVTLAGDDKATNILSDVMPFFSLGDNLTAFVSVGLGMMLPEEGDSLTGWHFNPFLQIGEEWGAKFLVGIKAWSGFRTWNDTEKKLNDAVTNWAVPIGLIVSF